MLAIKDTPPSHRFLMVAARISKCRWREECESVRSWLATKPTTVSSVTAERMLQTIDAPLPSDATPLVIIHCYADIPTGTKYDLAFEPHNPDNNESTQAEVLFGVVMGRVVETTLSHGWHQTAVLRFPSGLPQLFEKLSVDEMAPRYLGLCAQADFPSIRPTLHQEQ